MSYHILKIPVNREKAVFYYYKQLDVESVCLNPKQKELVSELPVERTLYLCHFIRPIEEEFVQKFLRPMGKIEQTVLGVFKNKACNKRKRRSCFYAAVVYKKQSDLQRLLSDSKVLQGVVNLIKKKQV